jgi:hypothetical protein
VFLLVSSAQAMAAKKQTMENEVSINSCCGISLTQTYDQELAVVKVAAPVPVAKFFMEPESDEASALIPDLWTLTSICISENV